MPEKESTSIATFRGATRTALRQQALAKTEPERRQALVNLVDTFYFVRADSRFRSSETLQSSEVRLRLRLKSIAADMERELRRGGRTRPLDLDGQIEALLMMHGKSSGTPKAEVVSEVLEASDSTSAQTIPSSATEKTRTPPSAASPLGRHAAATFDNGWQLVGLIQRVVRPDFWDVVGGKGHIEYFRPKRAIVVRATTEAHEDISDLLRALRP